MGELFIVLLLSGLIVFLNYRHYRTRYGRFPTFEEYKTKNPGLVKHGRVECVKCGGTHIYAKGLFSAVDRRKTHYCSTCGTPLYKSKH